MQQTDTTSGGGPITLIFTAFYLESRYDWVRVYDGPTTSSPLLGSFTGTSLPRDLTSTGGNMLITFTTNETIVTFGWSATYTTVVQGPCVNQTFTGTYGTITDNSGTLNYLNNMSCSKLIQPSCGESCFPTCMQVTLEFTSFSTEAGYDYVRVYDGSTTSSPLLGAFSGTSLLRF